MTCVKSLRAPQTSCEGRGLARKRKVKEIVEKSEVGVTGEAGSFVQDGEYGAWK